MGNMEKFYQNIQLGKDVRTQTESISRNTKALVAAQLASTSAVIASQERIAEGIHNVAYGIERVEQGIYGLQAAFEWGISEVVWQIEQNREVLKSILEVLMAPLDTQAKERRKRAENAYSNGWIEDAEEEFLESEKLNRYDFAIHISLGMIYFFHKNDKKKALEYFDKAIKYARPESKYHTSYALLYKAKIKCDSGLVEEAEKCTAEAIDLSPDFTEALYQNAQYNALLSRPDRSVKMLKAAIDHDRNYTMKADQEEAFKSIDKHIKKLFLDLKSAEINQAKQNLSQIVNKQQDISEIIKGEKSIDHNLKSEIDKGIARSNVLIKRDSYFDGVEANSVIREVIKVHKTYLGSLIDFFRGKVNQINSEKANITSQIKSKADSRVGTISIIGGVVGFFLGFRGCIAHMAGTNDFIESLLAWGSIWAVGYFSFYGISKAIFTGEPSDWKINDLDRVKERYQKTLSELLNLE